MRPGSKNNGAARGVTRGRRMQVDAALDAVEHGLDAGKVDQAAQGLFAGDLQQEVVGVVAAQRVIEDVGGEGGLPAGSCGGPGGSVRSGPR